MDTSDFFKGALDDSGHANAKSLGNFVGSTCWGAEFGLFVLLVGWSDDEYKVTNFVFMINVATIIFLIVLCHLFMVGFDSLPMGNHFLTKNHFHSKNKLRRLVRKV